MLYVRYINTHSLTHSLIRNELHCLLSTHDVVFKGLNDEEKIKYLLTLENETTSKIVGKYTFNVSEEKGYSTFKI